MAVTSLNFFIYVIIVKMKIRFQRPDKFSNADI
jgi:hypothetical protein